MSSEDSEYETFEVCGQCEMRCPCIFACKTPGWQRFRPSEKITHRKLLRCESCKRESRFWLNIEINGIKRVRCQDCINEIINGKRSY